MGFLVKLKTGSMFEIQPPQAQTLLNWNALWMTEVKVAMFRLVHGIYSAPMIEDSLGNWLVL